MDASGLEWIWIGQRGRDSDEQQNNGDRPLPRGPRPRATLSGRSDVRGDAAQTHPVAHPTVPKWEVVVRCLARGIGPPHLIA